MLNMEICSLGQEISSTHKIMDWVTHQTHFIYWVNVVHLGHPYNGGEEWNQMLVESFSKFVTTGQRKRSMSISWSTFSYRLLFEFHMTTVSNHPSVGNVRYVAKKSQNTRIWKFVNSFTNRDWITLRNVNHGQHRSLDIDRWKNFTKKNI